MGCVTDGGDWGWSVAKLELRDFGIFGMEGDPRCSSGGVSGKIE